MLAGISHILPLTYIRRTRVLPTSGRVEVREGQKVLASDVIARALLPSKHVVLDVRRVLGIGSQVAVEKYIVRKEGDQLVKGDVVAETGGMLSRQVRAPAEGEIISITGGKVLLRVQSTALELKAGFSGTVAEVIADRGAVIETHGSLLQGMWGNGRMDNGLFVVLPDLLEADLARSNLDVSLRGAVVLAGHCSNGEALQAGAELPLRGLILASMSSSLVPLASSLNYPILVMEGFGKMALSEAALKLLNSSEKRDVSVNAACDSKTGDRPEVIIPLPSVGEPAVETDTFAPNQTVRLIGAPYHGQVGTLVRVRPGLSLLPNGVRAPSADVQLNAETRVVIPLANLVVLK